MKNTYIFLALLFSFNQSIAQTVIDGSLAHQSDNNKKYSLYIPSDYNAAIPHQLMLGFHPLNTSRWNAESWRDTLINFAESNSLILVCPDGGPDGRVDDSIDTSFTTVLMDSISQWYSIDSNEKYIMGFSWGGKTTYTYGLRRTNQYAGFMPIGAAINGIAEISNVIQNAENEKFYLVHGSQDAINSRFTPLLNGLSNNEACVESNLLQGVGHTIDFPNRNAILTDAFNWLKSNNCNTTSISEETISAPLEFYPNPSLGDFTLKNIKDFDIESMRLTSINGQRLSYTINHNSIILNDNIKGIVLINLRAKSGQKLVYKMMIL